MSEKVRLALPKGRLQKGVESLLSRVGIMLRYDSDRCYSPTPNVAELEVRIRKVRAVPQIVALEQFDLGFCGFDLVRDSLDRDDIVTVMDTGMNPVTLVVAAHRSRIEILTNRPSRPVVIATEYVNLAEEWAVSKSLPAIVVNTFGSTEGYCPEDADLVFDCVETGETMEANGLVIIEELLRSTTLMVANRMSVERPAVMRFIETMREALEQGDKE